MQAIYLFGPTASGKTGLGINLAQALNGVIINADSRQLYRGLPILSAVPSAAEQAAAEHTLYEFLDPTEPFSVGDYLKAATNQAKRVIAAGKTPIFIGGTGLYFEALLQGISPIPPTSRTVSLALNDRAQLEGAPALHAELAKVDAATAANLHTTDTQRICRALAVYQESGLPISHWQKQPRAGALPYPSFKLALAPPRELILKRQSQRFETMVEAGLLNEVQTYLDQWSAIDINAQTTHGLKEIASHLRGEISLNEAKEQMIIQMRQYSKRQMTWLRNSYGADLILETADTNIALTAITCVA